jgi:hypothetical protein
MAGGAQGYEVKRDGMAGEAGKLDDAGNDVGKIRKAVADQMCYSNDALGGSETGPAYTNFAAAWQAEAQTLEDALHELAGKVRVSKRNYEGAEIDTEHRLNGAANGTASGTAGGAAGGGAHGPAISTQPAAGSPPPSLADFD